MSEVYADPVIEMTVQAPGNQVIGMEVGVVPGPVQRWVTEITDALAIKDTATGAPIASIPCGADGVPMRKLEVEFRPEQETYGNDPVPAGASKNLFNPAWFLDRTASGITSEAMPDGTFHLYGTATAQIRYSNSSPNIVLPAGTYVCKGSPNTVRVRVSGSAIDSDGVFTVDGNTAVYFGVAFTKESTYDIYEKIQIEAGSTATEWVPYKNVCPVTGRTGVKATRTGRNLLDVSSLTWTNKTRNNSGEESGTIATSRYSSDIPVLPGTTYTIGGTLVSGSTGYRIYYLDADGGWISRTGAQTADSFTFTTPANCGYIELQCPQGLSLGDVMLEYGETAHAYEAFGGTAEIALGGTYYGGKLDVISGILTVEMASVTIDGTETFADVTSANVTYAQADKLAVFDVSDTDCLCSLFPVAEAANSSSMGDNTVARQSSANSRLHIKSAMFAGMTAAQVATWFTSNNMQYVGWLKEPVTVQLDPVTVKTLLGQNYVWSEDGDVNVVYVADTKMYIDGKIAELAAQIVDS